MKKLAIAVLLAVAGCNTMEPTVSVGDTVVPAGKEIRVEFGGKYWQDAILKPNQSWIKAYGSDDHSVLAHGLAQLTRAVQAQAGAIGMLKQELNATKSIDGMVDPNEVAK